MRRGKQPKTSRVAGLESIRAWPAAYYYDARQAAVPSPPLRRLFAHSMEPAWTLLQAADRRQFLSASRFVERSHKQFSPLGPSLWRSRQL